MGANELSAALWRQREVLDLLLFKYEEEHLLLAAGKSRWIPQATREIETVVDQLRTAALRTSLAMATVGEEWGFPEDGKLGDVVTAAPTEAWKDIFGKHRDALKEQTHHIRQLRDTNDQLLRQALRSTQEMLSALSTPADTYTADGGSDRSTASPALVDTKA
ncbi:flagellar protein FlgN [Curtobacterium sp. MCBD17_040]|uniref:flagellar protein FlgN n=1 Tax=Curtobacterium sp. MCBD17_040 TaxID=2175674 RepID=UPI000DA9D334|nr:flagellar protein FlgN [Curtobacterium sp. MCBD17_040]WIB65565.1 flagellar protein FlgN [Curtobacterium sp. MCBD17_040]